MVSIVSDSHRGLLLNKLQTDVTNRWKKFDETAKKYALDIIGFSFNGDTRKQCNVWLIFQCLMISIVGFQINADVFGLLYIQDTVPIGKNVSLHFFAIEIHKVSRF